MPLSTPSRRTLTTATLLAGSLLIGGSLVACGSSDGELDAATRDVRIQGFAFGPADLTVPPGTTVTWTNADEADHTVTQSGGALFASADLATDDTFEVTFDEPGTYEYLCKFHPAMRGTVVVER